MLNKQLIISFYALLGLLLLGGCGRLFSDKSPTNQTCDESSYNSDLLLAKEVLKRIEAIFPGYSSNEDMEWHSITDKADRDCPSALLEYRTIKKIAEKTPLLQLQEIQAKAGKTITPWCNPTPDEEFDGIYNDLERLAFLNQTSEVIMGCWIDSIEDQMWELSEEDSLALCRKLKGWATENNNEIFCESYIRSEYFHLLIQVIYDDIDFLEDGVNPNKFKEVERGIEKFRNIIKELDMGPYRVYEAKAMDEYFSLCTLEEVDPQATVNYCSDLLNFAELEPDNLDLHRVIVDALVSALDNLSLMDLDNHEDYNMIFAGLEKLIESYNGKRAFVNLRAKGLAKHSNISENLNLTQKFHYELKLHIDKNETPFLRKLYIEYLCNTSCRFARYGDIRGSLQLYEILKSDVSQWWPNENYYKYQAQLLCVILERSCSQYSDKSKSTSTFNIFFPYVRPAGSEEFWKHYSEFEQLAEEYAIKVKKEGIETDPYELWEIWSYGMSQLVLESGGMRNFENAVIFYDKLNASLKKLPPNEIYKKRLAQAASSLSISYVINGKREEAQHYRDIIKKISSETAELACQKYIDDVYQLTNLYYHYFTSDIKKADQIYQELKNSEAEKRNFKIFYRAKELIEDGRRDFHRYNPYNEYWSTETF